MKGEVLTVLEQTTQLTHKRSYYVVASPTISLKKNYLGGQICWTEVGFTTKQ